MGGVLSAIAAGPQPIRIDPTLAIQRRIQIGDLQAQQAERLAQAQSIKVQADERQAAFNDQRALQRAFTETGGDFDKLPDLAISYGARVPAIQAVQAAHEKMVTDRLANDKATNELAVSHHEQLSRLLDGISQLPQDQRTAAMPGFWSKASQWLPPQELQTAQQTFGSTDDQTLKAFKATLDYGGNLAKEAIERQTAEAKTTEAATGVTREKREAAKQTAELPGIEAKSERDQIITNLMKGATQAQQSGVHPVDAILGQVDSQAAAAYKINYDAARQADMAAGKVDTPAANAVLERAAAHAAELSVSNRQKKVQDAVAVEMATSPLKVQQRVAAARAMRAGDNPALSGVAPADIPRVNATAQKLDQDYIKAKTQAEDIETVLNMAAAGNKAAGANVPLVGVGALNAVNGIKRINSAEIAQYGTAGSLLDKIQGKLQGWTEGQPIPKDVLNHMKALHEQLSQGSWKAYNEGLDSVNKRSGSKLAPTVEPPKSLSASSAGAVPNAVKTVLSDPKVKPGIHTLSDGSKWMKSADGTIAKQ